MLQPPVITLYISIYSRPPCLMFPVLLGLYLYALSRLFVPPLLYLNRNQSKNRPLIVEPEFAVVYMAFELFRLFGNAQLILDCWRFACVYTNVNYLLGYLSGRRRYGQFPVNYPGSE